MRDFVNNRLELALPQANSPGFRANSRLLLRRVAQTDQTCQLELTMSHQAKTGAALAILVLMLVMAPAANADPIQITTSTTGFDLLGLGNNGNGVTNPDFDSLFGFAHSASNTVDSMGGSFIAVLNPLLFRTGFTGFGSAGDWRVNFYELLTVNGQTQTLNLFGNLIITATQDSIEVFGGDPLIFQFDTFSVAATVLPVNLYGGENCEFRDFLRVRLEVIPNCDTTVPEPATLVLLGTGLAGIAAKVRKRRKGKPSALDSKVSD